MTKYSFSTVNALKSLPFPYSADGADLAELLTHYIQQAAEAEALSHTAHLAPSEKAAYRLRFQRAMLQVERLTAQAKEIMAQAGH